MACFLQQKRKRTIFVGVMKTKLIIFIFTAIGLTSTMLPSMAVTAQPTCQQGIPADTTTFKGHIENQEYQVWLDIGLKR